MPAETCYMEYTVSTIVRCFNEAADFCRRKPEEQPPPGALRRDASMRPPTFAGGNAPLAFHPHCAAVGASMRPPTFAGGNTGLDSTVGAGAGGFNEAADFCRRKPATAMAIRQPTGSASMRPPTFAGGNTTLAAAMVLEGVSFNEAADFCRRKPSTIRRRTATPVRSSGRNGSGRGELQ